MEEKLFCEENDVKVSATRFMVSGDTYPISNISSVKKSIEPSRRGWAVLLIVCGVLITLGGIAAASDGSGSGGLIFGLLLTVWGGAAYRKMKAKYIVLLTTAGSEVKALTSTDQDFIARVVQGLNDAIVARG